MDERSKPGRDDEFLDHVQELEDARAREATLTAENAALRLRLDPGGEAPPVAQRLSTARAAPALGYRGEDQVVRVERELNEVHVAIADLGIENAILRSRTELGTAPRATGLRRAGFAAAVFAGGSVLWFLTGSLPMLLAALLLTGLGWGLVALIDRIKPDASNPRDPPLLPPGIGM